MRDLLHLQKAGWNDQLLHQIFSEKECLAIRQIPVSSLGLNDRLIWHDSLTGQYSVKSGYKLAKIMQKRKEGDEGSSERREQEEVKLWQSIWNLDIKRKVQHFIWRLCHNRIPVGANLMQRAMAVAGICRQCGDSMETAEHVFFHCTKA